jgi:hypothetical protein
VNSFQKAVLRPCLADIAFSLDRRELSSPHMPRQDRTCPSSMTSDLDLLRVRSPGRGLVSVVAPAYADVSAFVSTDSTTCLRHRGFD